MVRRIYPSCCCNASQLICWLQLSGLYSWTAYIIKLVNWLFKEMLLSLTTTRKFKIKTYLLRRRVCEQVTHVIVAQEANVTPKPYQGFADAYRNIRNRLKECQWFFPTCKFFQFYSVHVSELWREKLNPPAPNSHQKLCLSSSSLEVIVEHIVFIHQNGNITNIWV